MLKLLQAQQDQLQTKATELKFPKFAGKSKQEFKRWYDIVLAILASPSWQSVFKDMSKKLLHADNEIPKALSASLYAALKTSLTGNAEVLMMSKPTTWGHGLLLLKTLRNAYRKRLQQAELFDKKMEYAQLYKKQGESYDDFMARCLTLCDLLVDHGIEATDL